MKIGKVEVLNRAGMHARPSALVAGLAASSKSDVMIVWVNPETGDREEANAKSVMSLIALGAPYKATLELIVAGEDEDEIYLRIEALFRHKFEEE